MLDSDQKTGRTFSCIVESEYAIVMTLNKLVFDVLVKEKLKMERVELSKFIYESLPNNKAKQIYS